jgi:hypothetical protein
MRAARCRARPPSRDRGWCRAAVADVGLLGVELDEVAGRNGEAHALAGFQHLAGGNALGLDAVGLQVGVELVQRGLVAP